MTGAGQSIGRAVALRLARDGADVAIVDIKQDNMNAVAEEVRRIGRRAASFKAVRWRESQVPIAHRRRWAKPSENLRAASAAFAPGCYVDFRCYVPSPMVSGTRTLKEPFSTSLRTEQMPHPQ